VVYKCYPKIVCEDNCIGVFHNRIRIALPFKISLFMALQLQVNFDSFNASLLNKRSNISFFSLFFLTDPKILTGSVCIHFYLDFKMVCLILYILLIHTSISFLTLWFLIKVTFSGKKLYLMTSHLESCKNHSEERMKQLRVILQKIKEAPEDSTVIFAGDTNLRDAEVPNELDHWFPTSGVCLTWKK